MRQPRRVRTWVSRRRGRGCSPRRSASRSVAASSIRRRASRRSSRATPAVRRRRPTRVASRRRRRSPTAIRSIQQLRTQTQKTQRRARRACVDDRRPAERTGLGPEHQPRLPARGAAAPRRQRSDDHVVPLVGASAARSTRRSRAGRASCLSTTRMLESSPVTTGSDHEATARGSRSRDRRRSRSTRRRARTIPTSSTSSNNRSTSAASSPSCAAPFPAGMLRRAPEESTMKKILHLHLRADCSFGACRPTAQRAACRDRRAAPA